ncbi:hypothetical protein Avbf_05437 [Armadillidium vulgare]|nr:hypothetical protein Avbf_05437 [Armadillidium vulgare]
MPMNLFQYWKNFHYRLKLLQHMRGNLVVGTKQGHLLMYSINSDSTSRMKINLLRSNKNFSRKPITQIAVVPEHQILISLSGSEEVMFCVIARCYISFKCVVHANFTVNVCRSVFCFEVKQLIMFFFIFGILGDNISALLQTRLFNLKEMKTKCRRHHNTLISRSKATAPFVSCNVLRRGKLKTVKS